MILESRASSEMVNEVGSPSVGIEIAKSPKEREILNLIEPVLIGAGFEAVDIDFVPMGRSLIRLFVDRPGQGVTLDGCAEASRLVEPSLESLSWLTGRYDLEVSSPGLDRRLRTLSHFENMLGQRVKLRLTQSIEGVGARVTGELKSASAIGIEVIRDGKLVTFGWAQVKEAHVVWQENSKSVS